MKTAFIIHGSMGHPKENWFPWLKKELEKLEYRVFVPAFPVPKVEAPGGHKLSAWTKEFKKYEKYINNDTIIIAHSRGCIFTYRLLERFTTPINSVFLVAPWITYLWNPKGYTGIDSFHETPFLWDRMKKSARYIEIFQSTNDDTPVKEGKLIAKKLGAQIVVVKNAGHFNVRYDKKFVKFDVLLKRIREHISHEK